MFRFNLTDDCNCSCGKDRETLQHVFLECELEEQSRETFKDRVKDLWMEKKCDGGLNIDLQLILAPFTINKLNTRDAEEILKFSFDFIDSVSKKL